MDVFDRAQELNEMFRAQALKAHFVRRDSPSPNPSHQGRGEIVCIDCGEEIDPARIKANPDAVRCIECQNKHERSERYGRA
jgi:DnaK suppressor protein